MGRPPKSKVTTVDLSAAPTPSHARNVRIDPDLVKKIMDEDEGNFLHVPPEVIPDGMKYEWKTASVLGQTQARRIGRYEARGWVPVPAERHPGLFTPKGYSGNIEYDGLILMERPKEICDIVEGKEYEKATGQVRGKEAQIMGGDVEGVRFDTKHKSARRVSGVSKSYEPFKVPEN